MYIIRIILYTRPKPQKLRGAAYTRYHVYYNIKLYRCLPDSRDKIYVYKLYKVSRSLGCIMTYNTRYYCSEIFSLIIIITLCAYVCDTIVFSGGCGNLSWEYVKVGRRRRGRPQCVYTSTRFSKNREPSDDVWAYQFQTFLKYPVCTKYDQSTRFIP